MSSATENNFLLIKIKIVKILIYLKYMLSNKKCIIRNIIFLF